MRRLILSLLLTVALASVASASPIDDVRTAMINFTEVHSFHMTMVTSDGMSMESDTVRPNRMHVTSSRFEAIMLPDAMYMKHDGTWTKLPTNGVGMNMLNDQMEKVRSDVKAGSFTATDLGMQTAGGMSLHAYRVVSTNSGKPITLYVNAQQLPARMEFTTTKGTGSATFSKFNAPMTINAPI